MSAPEVRAGQVWERGFFARYNRTATVIRVTPNGWVIFDDSLYGRSRKAGHTFNAVFPKLKRDEHGNEVKP